MLWAAERGGGCPRAARAELYALLAARAWQRSRVRKRRSRVELVLVTGRLARHRARLAEAGEVGPWSARWARVRKRRCVRAVRCCTHGLRQRPLVVGALPARKFCWCPRAVARAARLLWLRHRGVRWVQVPDGAGRAAPCVGKCVTVQELDSRRRPQRSAVNLASRCAQLPPASGSVATTAFPARWASEYAARQPILDGADAAQARAWVGVAGAVDHGSHVLAQRRGIPLTREKLRCALWKPAVDLSCRGYAKTIVDLRFVGGTRG
jgi:hypothetical protein